MIASTAQIYKTPFEPVPSRPTLLSFTCTTLPAIIGHPNDFTLFHLKKQYQLPNSSPISLPSPITHPSLTHHSTLTHPQPKMFTLTPATLTTTGLAEANSLALSFTADHTRHHYRRNPAAALAAGPSVLDRLHNTSATTAAYASAFHAVHTSNSLEQLARARAVTHCGADANRLVRRTVSRGLAGATLLGLAAWCGREGMERGGPRTPGGMFRGLCMMGRRRGWRLWRTRRWRWCWRGGSGLIRSMARRGGGWWSLGVLPGQSLRGTDRGRT